MLHVKDLPFDILLRVFQVVCSRPHNSLDVKCEPWSLGHVCSSWRHLVTEAHCLWSIVVLPAKAVYSSRLDLLDEYLRRSSHYPLHIAYHGRFASHREFNYGMEHRIVNILLEHSHRWKVVEIIANQVILALLTEDILGGLDVLQEFYLKAPGLAPVKDADLKAQTQVAEILLQAPHLLKADFRDAYLPASPTVDTRITHLGCTMKSLTHVKYLHTFSLIAELHIVCPDGADLRLPPVVLPSIEKLSVSSSYILNVLQLPNLTTLTIREYHPAACANLTAFVERSRCPLNVLSILAGQLLVEVDFTRTYFRQVERLTLPVPQSVIPCMRRLMDPSILPDLRTITVMVHGEHFVDQALRVAFVNFVERRYHQTDLRLLRLYCNEADFTALKDGGLGKLREEGLIVSLDVFNSEHEEWRWWRGPYWFPIVDVP